VSELGPGTEIAGYRIEHVLGRGGMGVLYVAEDVALGRKVALKVIAPELANDPAFRERFIRESQLAASIDHPNVIPIHRAGEERGTLFLAMRLVGGTNLRRIIAAEGPLGVERSAAIVRQVAAALDAAHARGLVHRDVKPANILVTERSSDAAEHVYLSDFGLTKRAESDTSITRTGQFLGTADYAAPEQFEGKPLDGRTDLYSLGCVLFECLTGEPPYRRDQEVASMYAHLREPIPVATDLRPELPQAVDGVIAKAMAKRPADRYASGAELTAALTGAVGSVQAPAASEVARRRRVVAIGGGIVAAIVAGVVGIVLATRGPEEGPSGPSPNADTPSIAIPVDGVVRFDPRTLRRVATTSVGVWPDVIVASGAYLYTMNRGDQTFSQIDTTTNKTLATRGGVAEPCPVLSPSSEGGIWVHSCGGQITLMSESPFEPVKTFTLPKGLFAASVVVLGDTLWVSTLDEEGLAGPPDVVLKMDATTGKVLQRVTVGKSPYAMVSALGSLWAANGDEGTLSKIDPATGQVQTFEGFTGPGYIAVGTRELWIEDYEAHAIYRFDLVRGSVTGVVQDARGVLALTQDALWALETDDDVLVRIDPETAEVVARYDVPNATGMTAAAGSLWISAGIDEG
jgi:DNA-binding beta-propeller fold protein YncE